MSLPPEIRDNIYHVCVIEVDEIAITPELRPPPLLSTCRQIRRETLPVWHFGNGFEIDIDLYDTTLYQAYIDNILIPQFGDASPSKWRLTIYLAGVHWGNLMEWCRIVWSRKTQAPRVSDDDMINKWAIVQAATNIAQKSRGMQWEEVMSLMKELQVVAGRLDYRWLE